MEYRCNGCNASFTTKRSMSQHLLENRTTFQCCLCSFQASRRYRTASHIQKVHGVRSGNIRRLTLNTMRCVKGELEGGESSEVSEEEVGSERKWGVGNGGIGDSVDSS